jgi:hypothetical protein
MREYQAAFFRNARYVVDLSDFLFRIVSVSMFYVSFSFFPAPHWCVYVFAAIVDARLSITD